MTVANTEGNKSEETKSGGVALSLRTVIILLVFINIAVVASIIVAIASTSGTKNNSDAIAQSSKSIQDLARIVQKDASVQIATTIRDYLTTANVMLQAAADVINTGLIDILDWDKYAPYLKTSVNTIGPKTNMFVVSLVTFYPSVNSFAVVPVVSQDGQTISSYLYSYFATNITCARFCPQRNTNNTLYRYTWDDATDQIGAQPTWSLSPFTFDGIPDFMPTRNVTKNVPLAMPDPFLMLGAVNLAMSFPVFNPAGRYVGILTEQFIVQNLCTVLDSMRANATPNTLYYILSRNGEVMAMSGLPNSTVQQAVLTKLVDPATQTYALKTIFDYPQSSYPLLNLSAATIYSYAGGNFASGFQDNQWYAGGYLFQVTTYKNLGFTFIIVSGAPDVDYLGDTVALAGRLADLQTKTNLATSLVAVGVIIVMSIGSVMFTWYFITRPLSRILEVIKKARKFDFSAVRDGSLAENRSIVSEVRNTQEHFMEMLQTFAKALKDNKALMTGSMSKSSTNGNSSAMELPARH